MPFELWNSEDENGNQEFNSSKTKADDIVNAVGGIVVAALTIVVVASSIADGLSQLATLYINYSELSKLRTPRI